MNAASLQTEYGSAEFTGIDTWDDLAILSALVEGQRRSVYAVRKALPMIAIAADATAKRLAAGGRLIYAGAGTSIRIAVQDGSELPATFGMVEDKLVYLIAGGRTAMFETLAGAEDDAAEGSNAVAAAQCTPGDVLIAVAASGTTPYTVAAAKRARELGALVIAVVNNPATPLASAAEHAIFLDTGPEVIAGSTRMGAGTAQKAALNLLSTLAHIKLGAVHDGMMVAVKADNLKLKTRARGIVARITGAGEDKAAAALEATRGDVKPAVLICAGAKSPAAARELLAATQGNLRRALARIAAS
jgi:N-acetylmuramic acid 6-phosphate etherase